MDNAVLERYVFVRPGTVDVCTTDAIRLAERALSLSSLLIKTTVDVLATTLGARFFAGFHVLSLEKG